MKILILGGKYEVQIISSYLILSFSLLCSFVQTKIEFSALVTKVPKERAELEFSFSISSSPIYIENAKIFIYGENINIIQSIPSIFNIPVYPNKVDVKSYIFLKEDKSYKISCYVLDSSNNFLSEKIVYARRVEGNAIEISQEQYIRFALDEKERWTLLQSKERANSDLEELRRKGLNIAIEKYPEGEEFPVQNNMNLEIKALSWDEDDQALLENAISDPSYKDLVKIDLNPPFGIEKEVIVQEKFEGNTCGGIRYGEVNEVIGFAMEGYNFTPIKSIKFYTSDNETEISAGTCHKEKINCEGNQIDIPIWDSGSEYVYVSQAGNNPSNLLYEYKLYGTDIPSWEVIATLKHTDLDPLLHPEKIVMYSDLHKIRNFWEAYYSTLIPSDYMKYKACILDMDSWGYSFEHKCISPIMTVDDGTAAWGVPPNWTPLFHLAGHWLQYKLQNNFIESVQENDACVILNSENSAFSEAFANWHKAFVQRGRVVGDPEEVELSAWCHPDYFPKAYEQPKKVAVFAEGFIQNMFDKYNSDDRYNCNPWPGPNPWCSDERLDENGNLIGWDYVYVPVSNLEKWKGNTNNNITEFISNWTQPDMPLHNNLELCPLLTTHYLEDLCP